MFNTTTYDMPACRLNTWKAMLEIFDSGKAKAVGVSNYEIVHLEEIVQAGLPLPSYNQCPFHFYRSTTQQDLIQYCEANHISYGGYSPFGVVDYHVYPQPMASSPLQDPVIQAIAKAHDVTPAQVILNWHYKLHIPTQPRSQNRQHMEDNLKSYDFELTNEDMNKLNAGPQDFCILDPEWYECAPNGCLRSESRTWIEPELLV
jgi:diketogulonate reductase-like aldo/keto reductase